MTAETLIAALESVPVGEPWAAPLAAAEQALAAERADALAKLFPTEITPVAPEALAAYAHYTGRLGNTNYGRELSLLHLRSISTYPALASICRSPEALADVGSAAALSNPMPGVADDARARYQRDIAVQISEAAKGDLQSAAQAYLALDALAGRLAAAKARNEAHAQAELASAEAERQAAARAEIDRAVQASRDAQRAVEEARAKLHLSEREYRAGRARALAARLRASGLRQLRVGAGDNVRVFSGTEVIACCEANSLSLESLSMYEIALAGSGAAP